MLPDIWPKDQPGLRVRVVVALGLLVLAKAATLVTPFAYRATVDGLAPEGRGDRRGPGDDGAGPMVWPG